MSEVTEPDEVDTVSDEIRRWSSLSESECQRFVSVEDGILNEFEMMWLLRILFPLHFVVFKQTACHLSAEANVEQVFSRAGQLPEVNRRSSLRSGLHLTLSTANNFTCII